LVVLKDEISVLGPDLGLVGLVLARAYTFTVFVDTYMYLVIMLLYNLKRFAAVCLPVCLITIIIHLAL